MLLTLTSAGADRQVIAHDALSALINLSDTLAAAKYLVDNDFLVWLISYTAVSWSCTRWKEIQYSQLTEQRTPHPLCHP